jgi:hypothetical protein
MAQAIDRGGVDPVDAAADGMADGGDRIAVVLAAPADRPVAADRPGAEADPGDVHVGPAKLLAFQQIILIGLIINFAE